MGGSYGKFSEDVSVWGCGPVFVSLPKAVAHGRSAERVSTYTRRDSQQKSTCTMIAKKKAEAPSQERVRTIGSSEQSLILAAKGPERGLCSGCGFT